MLSHFPGTPREGQAYVCSELERLWDGYDVFVIRAPVASGKSKIAECIARWGNAQGLRASVIAPNNVLVKQYADGIQSDTGATFLEDIRSQGLPYLDARQWAKNQPIKVLNYYSYLAYRAYSDVLIVDECHNLISFLGEFENLKLWGHQWPLPDTNNVLELLAWVQGSKDEKLAKLKKILTKHQDEYSLRWDYEMYRGRLQRVLVARNLTPRYNAPILWPRSVKKLVLMSATVDTEDLYDLGLDSRRVKFIDTESPIPVDRRPVIYDPVVVMNRSREASERMCEALETTIAAETTRGLVHTTYGLASRWQHLLRSDRWMFHSSWDKQQQMDRWLRTPNGVLVACGLTEGVDLAYKKAEWQDIAKLNYLNIGDPAVHAKMRARPRWYKWQAVREVLQASGRVSRAPDDRGITRIRDGAFERLYNENQDMFPKWFKEALR